MAKYTLSTGDKQLLLKFSMFRKRLMHIHDVQENKDVPLDSLLIGQKSGSQLRLKDFEDMMTASKTVSLNGQAKGVVAFAKA